MKMHLNHETRLERRPSSAKSRSRRAVGCLLRQARRGLDSASLLLRPHGLARVVLAVIVVLLAVAIGLLDQVVEQGAEDAHSAATKLLASRGDVVSGRLSCSDAQNDTIGLMSYDEGVRDREGRRGVQDDVVVVEPHEIKEVGHGL